MADISRTDWGRQFRECWLCRYHEGWSRAHGRYLALTTHELVGNSRRVRALTVPASWFRCCEECHAQLSSSPAPTELAKLLALKQVFDSENYDLREVNKLLSPNRRGGWDDGPITQAEVDAARKALFGKDA